MKAKGKSQRLSAFENFKRLRWIYFRLTCIGRHGRRWLEWYGSYLQSLPVPGCVKERFLGLDFIVNFKLFDLVFKVFKV